MLQRQPLKEGGGPKERIPDEVKLVYDPSMDISDGVASGTEDSDKWDKETKLMS